MPAGILHGTSSVMVCTVSVITIGVGCTVQGEEEALQREGEEEDKESVRDTGDTGKSIMSVVVFGEVKAEYASSWKGDLTYDDDVEGGVYSTTSGGFMHIGTGVCKVADFSNSVVQTALIMYVGEWNKNKKRSTHSAIHSQPLSYIYK